MPKKLRLEAPEIPGSVNMEKNEENRKIDRINQAEGISSDIRMNNPGLFLSPDWG